MGRPLTPRIAVLDDDTDFVDLLSQLFADQGWEVLCLADGTAALRVLADTRPDAIILDVRLAGEKSGWEVLDELGGDGRTQGIPVIMLSAARDELGEKEEWLASRGIGVVYKPFDIDELYAVIQAALTGKLAPREVGPTGDSSLPAGLP